MLETYMYSYVHVNPHARVLVDTLFNFIKKRFPWFFGYKINDNYADNKFMLYWNSLFKK